jgi:pimeloyl-ACP methyl ester carboxylesterase
VRAVLLIAGVAPYDLLGPAFLDGMGEDNVVGFGKAIAGEAALRPYMEERRPQMLETSAEALVTALASILPPVDRRVLTGEFGEDLTAEMRDALHDGVDGWLDDDLAFVAPWGFALDEVAVPTMLWQGDLDLMVPFHHGQWLAERIPGVAAHLEQGEGHLSIAIGAIDRMLAELAAAG